MQFSKRIKKALVTLASTLYLSSASTVWADDSDIFLYAHNLDSDVKPNVLFILDNSGSMQYAVGGTSDTRMEVMQSAFEDIMRNSSNLNVGLMKLHQRHGESSRLTFPVTDMDKPLAIEVLSSPRIAQSTDDVSEVIVGENKGQVNLLADELILGGGHLTALRFQTVGIPQSAKITSATISFTAAADSSDLGSQPEIVIQAGQPRKDSNGIGDNPTFDEGQNKPSGRTLLTRKTIWNPGTWEVGTEDEPSKYSVDVTDLLQDVINDQSWCGNDEASFYFRSDSAEESFRNAHSFDGEKALKPTLTVQYQQNGDTGCNNENLSIRIQAPSFDAYERNNIKAGRDTLSLERYYFRTRNTTVGLHYPALPIKKDANILKAELLLTASDTMRGKAEFSVAAHKDANSPAINVYDNNNISSRTTLNAPNPIIWKPDSWRENETKSQDIKDLLQEVVRLDDWQAGNNLTLLLKHRSNSDRLLLHSFEGNPAFSPRLEIKISSNDLDLSKRYKVRDHLISLVNSMYPDGGTPLAPAYYEAAKYFQTGWKDKRSPIDNVCQSNYTVLLTDGEANSNDAQSRINSLTNSYNCRSDAREEGEKCARTLASWLHNTDLITDNNMPDTQNVFTHTIAFGLEGKAGVQAFMEDLARNGGGQFYTAENAAELSDAFQKIFSSILEDESSFVSPGVAVNQFNSSRHLSQVYYSVFKPSKTDRWLGNLKKYKVIEKNNVLDVYDSEGNQAVDEKTGFFSKDSLSLWSKRQCDNSDGGKDCPADGRSVNKGGAGERLAYSTRNLLTYDSSDSKPELIQLGTTIPPQKFGLTSGETVRRNKIVDWINNPETWLGDPLHSVPALAAYKCSEEELTICPEDKQELTIFFGTNDGFIHAIDAATGNEEFAFIPEELLDNLDKLYEPSVTDIAPGPGRPYGMDGLITLWVNDANNNGYIFEPGRDTAESNEHIYLYAGMRRGGRSYYALDVTDRKKPELLWTIHGGDGVFKKLGQTWAKPIKTKIKVAGTIQDVLIFSGGYNPKEDNRAEYLDVNKDSGDLIGNAIYIINARTGELIWSASNDDSASLTLKRMQYSIPGGVRVIDMEGDGLADQLFFADTGGQVWRLYINNGNFSIENLVWPSDSDNDGKGEETDGVMANLGPTKARDSSDDGSIQQTHSRRFYVEPDVSLIRLNGQLNLAIGIGSGNRTDPLNRFSSVQDRAYMMVTRNYANPEVNSDNVKRPVPIHKTITNDQLMDITANLSASFEDIYGSSSNQPMHEGWYINMEHKDDNGDDIGEKIVTEFVTFEGVVYFNTYLISNKISTSCNPTPGSARAYAVDLITGNPVNEEDLDDDGMPERYTNLANSGLPPTTSILFPEGSKDALICVGAECDPLEIGDDKQATYWRQVR